MKQPHKHAAVIKAWADGAAIEKALHTGQGCVHWVGDEYPSWNPCSMYRVKPEPKPDVVLYGALNYRGHTCDFGETKRYVDNIKATFDGDTHQLKSLEVIK